ncbi:BsaA family SipW-dependent biofilm matrix protein [Enterococcus sp. LJL99]
MGKRKSALRRTSKNRMHLFILSIILSLILVVGSTYSWITYSDEVINRSKTNTRKLSATINESYETNLQWTAGEISEKKLWIQNNGQTPALVRVSLYEFFVNFELEVSDGEGQGNGSLKIVDKANSLMTLKDVSTWEKRSHYEISSKGSPKKYLTAAEVYKSDKTNSQTAYKYKASSTKDFLTNVTINFNENDIYHEGKAPANNTKNYWYYSDGYFYYSEELQPNEETTLLLQSISIDGKLANKYKGSLYQLLPVMEAHDNTKSLLEDWQIVSNSDVSDIYREKLH